MSQIGRAVLKHYRKRKADALRLARRGSLLVGRANARATKLAFPEWPFAASSFTRIDEGDDDPPPPHPESMRAIWDAEHTD